MDFARTHYRLIILHPLSNIRALDVAALRRGPDNLAGSSDDVLVFAYLSVGEDDRPGAPFTGDGLGPRVDPRPSDGAPLSTITNLIGAPSPAGTGYASYYLDTKSSADGLPDRNSVFGGCYVNAGAPAWWDVIQHMTKAQDGRAGLDELLTTNTGAGYDFDGVFLDTLDTAAPNSFGGTQFEWTAPGMQLLLQKIHTNYSTKYLIGNRGLFFYNPNLKTYEFNPRLYLNGVLFESYFTDSNNANEISPSFPDNKYNFAPKLNAEAGRGDGFTVLALDYEHSPPLPQSIVDQDFLETMGTQGWPLYRTDASLTSAFSTNSALWIATHPDTQPPNWDSTAAQGPVQASPRVGLQEVVTGDHSVTLRWDLARDQTGPLRYNVYYTTNSSLDFATAVSLKNVSPTVPSSYATGTGPGIYPYEYTVSGLSNGTAYLFAVRAEDSAVPSHEDTNTVVWSAVPTAAGGAGTFRYISVDGNFQDWAGVPVLATAQPTASPISFASVSTANDGNYLYLRFTLHATGSPFSDYNTHLFIDADTNATTGYRPTGSTFGSELMVESGTGYDERNGAFNEGVLSGLGWALAPNGNASDFELRISRQVKSSLGTLLLTNRAIRIMLQDNRGSMLLPQGVVYSFADAGPYEVWLAQHFTATELANPAISGDGADPDKDGIPNLLEYAFGLDPRAAGNPGLPRAFIQAAGGAPFLHIQFTRRNAPAGVTYLPQMSTNLTDWVDASPEFQEIAALDNGDGTSLVTLSQTTPVAVGAEIFVRIAVQR